MPENENQHAQNEGENNEITEYYEGIKQLEIQGYETGIKKARNALFVTAALLFIGEMISAAISDLPFTLLFWAIVLVEAGAFVALAFWTKTKPYAAIIVGLVLFFLIWILGIVAGGFEDAF